MGVQQNMPFDEHALSDSVNVSLGVSSFSCCGLLPVRTALWRSLHFSLRLSFSIPNAIFCCALTFSPRFSPLSDSQYCPGSNRAEISYPSYSASRQRFQRAVAKVNATAVSKQQCFTLTPSEFRIMKHFLPELPEINAITGFAPQIAPPIVPQSAFPSLLLLFSLLQTAYFAAFAPDTSASRPSLIVERLFQQQLVGSLNAYLECFAPLSSQIIAKTSRGQQLFIFTPAETSLIFQPRRVVTGRSSGERGVNALINFASAWGCSNGRP